MRFAILAAAESWYLEDLRRAAAERHEIVRFPFTRLASTVGFSAGGAIAGGGFTGAIRPVDVDAVLVRTMPPGSLEQVVLRMDILAQWEAAKVPVLNPARALETAVDKYLTTARLAAAGLPTPRTVACQSVEDGLAAFAALGGDVVLKPLFGGEGRGIARIQDEAIAERTFRLVTQLGGAIYLQEFIPHAGSDVRLLVIGSRVLAIRRTNGSDWRTNLSRGAVAEAIHPDDAWAELARRAAECVGATLAGVDLLPGLDGKVYVLEVNAAPGWRGLAAAHGVDVSAMVLDYLEKLARAEQG